MCVCVDDGVCVCASIGMSVISVCVNCVPMCVCLCEL